MRLDDQLRDIARRADLQQRVITAEEIVQRAASRGTASFPTNSRFDDDRRVVTDTPVQFDDMTTVDLDNQRPANQHRKTPKRVVQAALLAAVAVIAIALVAIRIEDDSSVDQPSSTVTAVSTVPSATAVSTVPSAPPTSEPSFSDLFGQNSEQLTVGELKSGTYAYLDVDGQGFNVRFTVPEGWSWNGRYLSKGGIDLPDGAAIFLYGGPVEVYSDPCNWIGSGSELSTGSDVIDLLSVQPMRNSTEPISRPAHFPRDMVPGPSGKIVDLTVPDDLDFAGCDGGQFRSFGPETNARSHQGPGQHDLVWGVDVGGAGVTDQYGNAPKTVPPGGLIIDAASFAGTPAEVSAEIDAILDSIATGHWG